MPRLNTRTSPATQCVERASDIRRVRLLLCPGLAEGASAICTHQNIDLEGYFRNSSRWPHRWPHTAVQPPDKLRAEADQSLAGLVRPSSLQTVASRTAAFPSRLHSLLSLRRLATAARNNLALPPRSPFSPCQDHDPPDPAYPGSATLAVNPVCPAPSPICRARCRPGQEKNSWIPGEGAGGFRLAQGWGVLHSRL